MILIKEAPQILLVIDLQGSLEIFSYNIILQ